MKVGSVFSGCDGMWLGVEAVIGGRLAWHAEVDKDAAKVLAARYPGVPNLGDVTVIDWSTVEPVDVLIGGPPCQAVSSAGKGLGSADPRWMWPEALRAMAELRPALCLWENPSRLLTGADKDEEDDGAPSGDSGGWGLDGAATDPRWFGWLLGEMAALGFDAWWTCLRSSDVGAPHGRDRVFLACAPADAGGAGAWWDGGAAPVAQEPTGRGEQGHDDPSVAGGATPPHPDLPGWQGPQPAGRHDLPAGSGGAAVGALLPTPTDRGGRGTPNPETARRRMDDEGRRNLEDAVALLPTPTAGDAHSTRNATADERWDRSGAHPGVTLTDAATSRWGRYTAAVERWERLFRPAPDPTDEKGRLNPALPEWMMGLPEGWVTQVPGVSRTAQLRILGNSCQPQVAAAATSALLYSALKAIRHASASM